MFSEAFTLRLKNIRIKIRLNKNWLNIFAQFGLAKNNPEHSGLFLFGAARWKEVNCYGLTPAELLRCY